MFTKLPGFRIPPIVNLVTCDGQTLIAKYSPERNLLFGMTEMIRKYSIRATDVMIFSLSNNCTFVVSLFKISGMESKYIVAERYGAETVVNSVSEQIRNNAQASNEVHFALLQFRFMWSDFILYSASVQNFTYIIIICRFRRS